MYFRYSLCIALLMGMVGCSLSGDDSGASDCIRISNFRDSVVPPAGIAMSFRVLGCDGEPVRPLTAEDVGVINGETGKDFNDSSEGGARSDPGTPDNVRVYAMLILDFSTSIFENNAQLDVVEGAQAFVDGTLLGQDSNLTYEVAIVAFGAPDQVELVADFTGDAGVLEAALSSALSEGSRGTTDLYGAYSLALGLLQAEGQGAESQGDIVERVAVVMTDGTHEAGDADNRRATALDAKSELDGVVYAIGIEGDYDPEALAELASSDRAFLEVSQASQLVSAFEDVSGRAEALARSNYVVGVCTPVALGSGTVELSVAVDGATDTVDGKYSTEQLTGDVDSCDPSAVAAGLGGDTDTDTETDTGTAPHGSLEVSPATVDFGIISIGEQGEESAEIVNGTNGTVSVVEIEFSNDVWGWRDDTSLPWFLPEGGTAELDLLFTPSVPVEHTGTATILTGDEGVYAVVNLRGSGE